MRISIRIKLMAVSLVLVVAPIAVLCGYGYTRVTAFGQTATAKAREGLEQQAEALLQHGARTDEERIRAFITESGNRVRQLAASANIRSLLAAKTGKDEAILQEKKTELARVLEGFVGACRAQQQLLYRKLECDCKIAADRLVSLGAPCEIPGQKVEWDATNQFTSETQRCALPPLAFGTKRIEAVKETGTQVVLVDDIMRLTGDTCTVFQRMNEDGDMLRVATNVLKKDGTRAIGTFIPVKAPDGKPNAVLAAVLKGETYRGRAFVVSEWYIAVYQPLLDASARVIGMLYVGVKEQDCRELTDMIVATKIGKEGYPFVMDSKGVLLVHPRKDLVGKNVISDLKIASFKEVLEKRAAGAVQHLDYEFEGRLKGVTYTYFSEWDWVINASFYWDDFCRERTEAAIAALKGEMEALYRVAVFDDGTARVPLYPQIRFLDEHGMEVFKLVMGKWATDLKPKGDMDWCKGALATKDGEIHNSGVALAENTAAPEMRFSSPVWVQGACRGLVVLNLDWRIPSRLLATSVYGKSGFAYILDEKGTVVAHPAYAVGDKVSFADQKYGDLSDLVRNKIIKGETGIARYSIDGVETQAAYRPLAAGDKSYAIVAACPVSEFLAAATGIETYGRDQLAELSTAAGKVACGMLIGGLLIAFLISFSMTRRIKRVSGVAKAMARGDLRERSRARSSDELGELGTCLDKSLGELNRILGEVSQSSNELTASSEQLAAVSISLVKGASTTTEGSEMVASATSKVSNLVSAIASSSEQMRNSIDTVSMTAKDMSANMQTVATTIDAMSSAIGEVARNAQEGARVSDEAMASSTEATKTMDALGAVAREIGEVTQTIREIAEQTNLLALNATITAASAGAAGKAFAVVASEIKDLANKSRQATERIAERISAVQSNSAKATESMRAIAGIIATLSTASESIAAAVEEQKASVTSIAHNVQEVTSGAEGIATSIASIASGANAMSTNATDAAKWASDVAGRIRDVHTTASNSDKEARKVDTASGRLAKVASQLHALVGKFSLARE